MIAQQHSDGWVSFILRLNPNSDPEHALTMMDPTKQRLSSICVLTPLVTEWLEQQAIEYKHNPVYRLDSVSDIRLLFKDPRDAMAFKFRFG